MSYRSSTSTRHAAFTRSPTDDPSRGALSGDAFDREWRRATRRAGAACCGIGYLAAVADGGVLITHGDGLIAPESRLAHVGAAIVLGVGCFVGAWLITAGDRSDARARVLPSLIRTLSPLFLLLAFESAGMALGLASSIATLSWYSPTVVAVSGLLGLIAMHVGAIARGAGERKLAFHCRLTAGCFALAYAAFGVVVVGAATHGVNLLWNPNAPLPTRPFAPGVEVALGGAALLGLVGIGIGIVLYEKILLGLWHALRPAS